ncbi:MAG: DNA primase [Phycisphaeraceae bacterium]|nr:DNA primase [Phycisphaeraceae bacterium]
MQSDRDRVLEATDLVALIGEHVALRPKGREHVGLCPFHDDRTPSMAVVTHKGNAFYKCFACGAAGNAIDFMMQYHRMEFPEALRTLASRAGIELRRMERDASSSDPASSRTMLRRAHQLAQRFFRHALGDEKLGAPARDALTKRRLAPEMVERFALGAAPDGWDHFVRHVERLARHAGGAGGSSRGSASSADADESAPVRAAFEAAGLIRQGQRGPIDGFRNRLIFPICDELGAPIAFGARKINPDDEPKYLNSPESAIFHKGRSLYGLHLAKRSIIERRVALVCEGYTDCMACHGAGFDHAVATLGTALTHDHARMLQRLAERVILLFDGDEAGQRAADRAVEVFFAETVDVLICTLPDGLDPDELLSQPEGAERFRAALEGSVDAITYQVRRFESQWRLATGLSGRQQRLEAMVRRLSDLGLGRMTGIRKQLVLSRLADLSGVRIDELERAIASLTKPVSGRPDRVAIGQPAGAGRPAVMSSPASPAVEVGREDTTDDRGDAPRATPTSPRGGAERSEALSARQRARLDAERNLLALLLAAPELAGESLPTEDGALPITEAFAPSAFEGPGHQEIVDALWRGIESGNAPTLQSVLADLENGVDKSLASSLFSIGARRLDPAFRSERSPNQAVQEAAADLDRILRRETLDAARPIPDAPLTPDLLVAELERLRRLGPNPAAIARTGGGGSSFNRARL